MRKIMEMSKFEEAMLWAGEEIQPEEFNMFYVSPDLNKWNREAKELWNSIVGNEEEGIFLHRGDIDDLIFRDDAVYNSVDWSSPETDEDWRNEVYNTLMKPADHYLVAAMHCRWNGASGYKMADSVLDALYRPYDATLVFKGCTAGRKIMCCTESSHDAYGKLTYIIKKKKKEYERLHLYDHEFDLDAAAQLAEKCENQFDAFAEKKKEYFQRAAE